MLCVVAETTERVVGERRMAHLRDLAAAVATTRTESDVLAAVAEQLGRNQADLPFSLTYLFDDAGARGSGCASGIDAGARRGAGRRRRRTTRRGLAAGAASGPVSGSLVDDLARPLPRTADRGLAAAARRRRSPSRSPPSAQGAAPVTGLPRGRA